MEVFLIGPYRYRLSGFAVWAALLFLITPAAWCAAGQTPGEAKTVTFFPPPDPANFTATTPSRETVEAYLKESWGYDKNRVWQIQAILKTPVEGVSKVIVFIGDKSGESEAGFTELYVMPDGKHFLQASLGSDLSTFGEKPYSEVRSILQKRADGPSRGAAAKDLEIVELVDYQCPFCKLEHVDLKQMLTDFPNAHYVFQPIPLSYIHAASALAAAYGYCVAKQGGNNAFFHYNDEVFINQEGLNSPETAQRTLDGAAKSAGLDAAKVAACATASEAKAKVEEWRKLSQDLGVYIPVISINGRMLPEGHYPYERLKEIIEYQARHDGVAK
jgi:protein-disulfide isomerase